MIDEELHDQASLYVLRMLPPEEEAAFAHRVEHDAELQAIVAELEDASAMLACSAPVQAPPRGLKERIMADVRHEVRVVSMSSARRTQWIPWAIAACFAIVATAFWGDSKSS